MEFAIGLSKLVVLRVGSLSLVAESMKSSITSMMLSSNDCSFIMDITMRYVKWWKQSMLGHEDFVKKIVKQKRSLSSRKCKTHVGKANKNGIYVCDQPGFCPYLEDTPYFRIFSSSDVPAENDAHDCEQI
ncbi:hypothetical protein MTR_7g034015 [Medicago truncatula]|uniref:Uncharacterized protein n=1 Tax=Medicago truncatula TaxID=3880 RepID=A0A072U8J0_MEDTR|nr:hypothetical protein MTR_7g034015 [Medicago truncatula]